MAQNKPKGWVKEPVRHGLAAKGIKTGKKQTVPRALKPALVERADKMLDLIHGLSPADLFVFERNIPITYQNKAIEMETEREAGTESFGAYPRAHRYRVNRLSRMILTLDHGGLLNLKRNIPVKFQRKLEVEGF